MVLRLRLIGGAVSALVLAALSVGMASPATAAGPLPMLAGACGGSMSSVTACPSNVLMLKEAGLLAMPSTGGGTVGVVSTSGQAVGGALGLLGGIAAGFGITQLFGAGDETVQSGGVLSTDGMRDQSLSVAPGASFEVQPNWTSGQLCKTSPQGCVSVRSRKTVGKVGSTDQWDVTTFTYSGSLVYPMWLKLASGAWQQAYDSSGPKWIDGPEFGFNANGTRINGPAGTIAVRWNDVGVGISDPIVGISLTNGGSVTAVTNGATPVTQQDGVLKMHTWCADPTNPGGPLVDYMTAQIATLQAGQSVNLQNRVCPSGAAAADASIVWEPGGGAPAKTIVPPRGETAVRADPVVAANIANPGCAGGSCLLVLEKVNGEPCGSVGQLCPDWAKDPNYSTNYRCKFGGQVVALSACSAYRSPRDGVQPNTKADGSPYQVTDPVVEPGGQTVTTPTTAPGGGTAPAPVTSVPAAEDPNGCRSQSWIDTLNPFNMFNTIGCALEAAFVPDPAKVEASVQGVKNSWANTPPVKVAGMVNSITAALPSGSGCSGITFTFPSVLGVPAQNFSVLNACSEPVAGVALIVRIIGNIGMVIFGILALTKMAGGVIALPGLGKTGDGA